MKMLRYIPLIFVAWVTIATLDRVLFVRHMDGSVGSHFYAGAGVECQSPAVEVSGNLYRCDRLGAGVAVWPFYVERTSDKLAAAFTGRFNGTGE